jgi:hypothetical protein
LRVSIHQPDYLPHKPYFEKIRASDLFVFLDCVQFEKNGFVNRNRVRSSRDWQWLTVPVVNQGLTHSLIKDVLVSGSSDWRLKHWRTLQTVYGKAPGFRKYRTFFEETYREEWVTLSDLNEHLVKGVCDILNIHTKMMDASSLNPAGARTDLLIDICRRVGADTYLSGPSGRNYLELTKFHDAGIRVEFQGQEHGDTVNLSIVDDLFRGV